MSHFCGWLRNKDTTRSNKLKRWKALDLDAHLFHFVKQALLHFQAGDPLEQRMHALPIADASAERVKEFAADAPPPKNLSLKIDR